MGEQQFRGGPVDHEVVEGKRPDEDPDAKAEEHQRDRNGRHIPEPLTLHSAVCARRIRRHDPEVLFGSAEDFRIVTSDPARANGAVQRQWLRYMPAISIALMLFRFRVRIFIRPLPLNDFMVYWSAAKLLLAHADPYSAAAMTGIERNLGWTLS